MKSSTLSVVIPTYNRAAMLSQAVDSVLAQTWTQWEVWVADDGSTDDTAAAIRPYLADKRVRYLRLSHSGLPATARNAALKKARGQLIAFLDSDDRWLPQKLEKQVEILNKHPEIGLVCSNAFVSAKGLKNPRRTYLADQPSRAGRSLGELISRNFVITSTVVARRAGIDRAGAFSELRLLRGIEDYDLWLRIAAHTGVCYLTEPLAVYRDDPANSIRSQQASSPYWRGMLLVLERLEQHLAACACKQALPDELLANAVYGYERELCDACLSEGRWLDAAGSWLRLLRKRPFRATRWGCAKIKGSIAGAIRRPS